MLILPPWLNMMALPTPDEASLSMPPSHLPDGMQPKHRGQQHDVPSENSTVLLHFALPGHSPDTAGTLLHMDMAAGKKRKLFFDKDKVQASDAEAGVCRPEQWWAFGSGVAVYDLMQVRFCADSFQFSTILYTAIVLNVKVTARSHHFSTVATACSTDHRHGFLHWWIGISVVHRFVWRLQEGECSIPALESKALAAFQAFRSTFVNESTGESSTPANLDDELYSWQLDWDEKKPPAKNSPKRAWHKLYGDYLRSDEYQQMTSSGVLVAPWPRL